MRYPCSNITAHLWDYKDLQKRISISRIQIANWLNIFSFLKYGFPIFSMKKNASDYLFTYVEKGPYSTTVNWNLVNLQRS